MITEAFDRLYADGAVTGRLLVLNLHPTRIGQPFRIKYLDLALGHITRHQGCRVATGREIVDWYLNQSGVVEDQLLAPGPVGDERAVLALSNTALLCFISLCSCFSMGAFSPLLPEIGRAGALADWQLGVVAGALGFARMAAAIPPAGWPAATSAPRSARRRRSCSPVPCSWPRLRRFRAWCSGGSSWFCVHPRPP
jgi:hypothetical protein